MPARMTRLARRISRIGLTLCVLCGLTAGTEGFSIVPPGTMGGAFPCQGNGCGCRTASDCWSGCCCMSPAQRLAWARVNDVEPPSHLLKLVRDGEASKTRPVAACCAKHRQATCEPPETTAKVSCCIKKVPTEVMTTKRSPRSNDDGPYVASGRCHGPGQWWVTSGQPLGLPERPATMCMTAITQPVLLCEREYSLDGQAPPTRPG